MQLGDRQDHVSIGEDALPCVWVVLHKRRKDDGRFLVCHPDTSTAAVCSRFIRRANTAKLVFFVPSFAVHEVHFNFPAIRMASPALRSPAASATWLYALIGTNSMKACPVGQGSVSFRVKCACCVPWSADLVMGSRASVPVNVMWFRSVSICLLLHGRDSAASISGSCCWRGMVRHVWHSA